MFSVPVDAVVHQSRTASGDNHRACVPSSVSHAMLCTSSSSLLLSILELSDTKVYEPWIRCFVRKSVGHPPEWMLWCTRVGQPPDTITAPVGFHAHQVSSQTLTAAGRENAYTHHVLHDRGSGRPEELLELI